MEVSAAYPGKEAKQAVRPATLVARLTAPLLSALADRYQDTFVRDGQTPAPQTENKGLWAAGVELVSNAVDKVAAGVEYAWDKTKATAGWLRDQAKALSNWVASKVAKAFSVFTRSAPEEERRRQEEATYEKKYQERKAEEKRLDALTQEKRAEEIRLTAKRVEDTQQAAGHKAAADAAAVAVMVTDRVSAPVPGAEKKHQLVDNATLERRRVRKLLTGMLPA